MRLVSYDELTGVAGGVYYSDACLNYNDLYWMHEDASNDGWRTGLFSGAVALTLFATYDYAPATVFWGSVAIGSIGYNMGYVTSDAWILYW